MAKTSINLRYLGAFSFANFYKQFIKDFNIIITSLTFILKIMTLLNLNQVGHIGNHENKLDIDND